MGENLDFGLMIPIFVKKNIVHWHIDGRPLVYAWQKGRGGATSKHDAGWAHFTKDQYKFLRCLTYKFLAYRGHHVLD